MENNKDFLSSQDYCIGLRRYLNNFTHKPNIDLNGKFLLKMKLYPFMVKSRLGSKGKSYPEIIDLPNDFNRKCVFITSS